MIMPIIVLAFINPPLESNRSVFTKGNYPAYLDDSGGWLLFLMNRAITATMVATTVAKNIPNWIACSFLHMSPCKHPPFPRECQPPIHCMQPLILFYHFKGLITDKSKQMIFILEQPKPSFTNAPKWRISNMLISVLEGVL